MASAVHIELPDFLIQANAAELVLPDAEARMNFVLGLARRNIDADGGPFAAAVFETATGRLVAAAANRVVVSHCSSAHAEILALSLAQQRLGHFNLGDGNLPHHELVSSAEPCAMCLGAICWSGVRQLTYAAPEQAISALGFDEGPKPHRWQDKLRRRGISVTGKVLQAEGCAILDAYRKRGGRIYNARA